MTTHSHTQAGAHTKTGTGRHDAYVTVSPQTLGRLRLLTVGPVELNLDGMAVRVAGRSVHMAPKEFELLAFIIREHYVL